MAKNIIICSDGTGNTAIKGRGTNVFKIFEAADLNGHRYDPRLVPQVAIYDDGVGTESFKPLKLLAGATGYGLGRNVRQLYKELCRIYDPGDRIFLFGFSRGAFTVRTLAGLICTCGIINARAGSQSSAEVFEQTVRKAYRAYRSRYRTVVMEWLRGKPSGEPAARFKAEFAHPGDARIAFIGVWDTVDAVGLPVHLSDFVNAFIYRFKFPDRRLSGQVERACHALAIDDERHSFHPLLWDEQARSQNDGQKIEQVWFAGAHSNVGGGYPKQGMSLVALGWMMQKARDAGLRFVASDRASYGDHANVDDKLYDPRSGLGMFYRWKPRDIEDMCRENAVATAVHLSVLERIAHGTEDYNPGNLPPRARVVITPTGDRAKDATADQRAAEVQDVLSSAHAGSPSLLAQVRTKVLLGRTSSLLFVLSCVALVLAAAVLGEPGSLAGPWAFLKSIALLLWGVVTSPFDTANEVLSNLREHRVVLGVLAAGFIASYVLGRIADRGMSKVFSQFWHQQQQRLRDALKRAREAASAGPAPARPSGAVGAGSRGARVPAAVGAREPER
jgi:uncharacterized protein (DUF2235 family)